MVLTYLHKLIMHWSVVEYERCLVSLGKQNCNNARNTTDNTRQLNKGEPSKNSRNKRRSSNLWKTWGFFTSGEKMKRNEKVHGVENGSRVATEQVMDLRSMNMVAKDAIAAFAKENTSLQRGESIFKQHWDIEHEEYLKGLSLISHPALLSYVLRFCKEYAKEHQMNYTEVYSRLEDSDSTEYYAYFKYLEEHLPNLTDFVSVLRVTNATSVTVAGSTINVSIMQT